MDVRKKIKGIAKFTGKYTLKGIGKGVELLGRGTLGTVNALVKNPGLQKIATTAGILAASVAIPTFGIGLLGALGIKYVVDNAFRGRKTSVFEETMNILHKGNSVTKAISEKVISPTLKDLNKNIKSLGQSYQQGVEDLFR